jgi:site-specific recombinase XerD
MLHNTISTFLTYCKTYGFGTRSLEVFASVLNKFSNYIKSLHLKSIQDLSYKHVLSFLISGNPSVYTKKHRVWTLHQFFHYLKTIKIFKTNIAFTLPYPKIDTKEPDFLSVKALTLILDYFISAANSRIGVRNLIIVLFLVFLGLRISAIIKINIQDIDLKSSCVLVTEKGNRKRIIPLPHILCFFLYSYITSLDRDLGPLVLSQRNKRLSHRMTQHLFKEASNALGMHIYSRVFRHTAATQLNQVAGLYVTRQILGHRRRESTKRYVHLNPDVYAAYMKRHPFMNLNVKENAGE